MITLPTNHPYFFTCPSCGCKLISVSTGNRAKPHCPKCDYSADDAFVVKDRVTSEAMNVIADNTELAENFAETVNTKLRPMTILTLISVFIWQTTSETRALHPKSF